MRLLAVGGAALLLATAFPAAARAAARAADDKPPTLHSIEFNRDAITVRGLDVSLLVVSVHLSDPDGVSDQSVADDYSPSVRVGPGRAIRLALGTGTDTDGVWTGGVAVTSDWSGEVQPTSLTAVDKKGRTLTVDPREVLEDVPTVTVTSSNRPKLAMTFTPDPATPGAAITQRVTATNSETGRPLSGVPVVLTDDTQCATPLQLPREPTARTNSAGVATRAIPAGGINIPIYCAWISADNVPEQEPTQIAPTGGQPNYRYVVTAKPASAAVPARTNVAVTGTVAPHAQGKELQLQRLYAANDWRTVNRGTVDPDSKFSITATPPGVGTYSYRVFAPAQENRVAAYSPVFTVRGT